KVYLCPTRRGTDTGFSTGEPAPDRPGGLSDYATSTGTTDNPANPSFSDGMIIIGSWTFTDTSNTKVARWGSQTKITDVADGTSNTLMIGEKHVRPMSRWGKNEDRSVFNGAN